MGCHPSYWRTPSFFRRGRYTTNQLGLNPQSDDISWKKSHCFWWRFSHPMTHQTTRFYGIALLQDGAPKIAKLPYKWLNSMVYACLCLRTENRSRKTHVFEYRDCGLGWGGVGGYVNVPCTSYMTYCHAAKISGIAYYVTCCYAAEISSVGWGGVGWGWGAC